MMLACEYEYFELEEQVVDDYFEDWEEDDSFEDWEESDDLSDWEDTDLELGFDPYMGCYSWDC